jgi:hypothetical protein
MSEFRGSRDGNVKETMQQEYLISRYAKSRLKSQSLNKDQIWTVDSSPCRSFGDQELDMSKIIDISESRYRDM